MATVIQCDWCGKWCGKCDVNGYRGNVQISVCDDVRISANFERIQPPKDLCRSCFNDLVRYFNDGKPSNPKVKDA